MRAFITKYALTRGIEQVSADSNAAYPNSIMALIKGKKCEQLFFRNEYRLTLEEANAHAEQNRKRKIAHLKSQIKKLEELNF